VRTLTRVGVRTQVTEKIKGAAVEAAETAKEIDQRYHVRDGVLPVPACVCGSVCSLCIPAGLRHRQSRSRPRLRELQASGMLAVLDEHVLSSPTGGGSADPQLNSTYPGCPLTGLSEGEGGRHRGLPEGQGGVCMCARKCVYT
jgi:hypothetical protein